MPSTAGSLSLYGGCAARWTENRGTQYAIETDGGLKATFTELRADFVPGANCALLVTYANGGKGIVKNPIFNSELTNNDTYKKYLVGNVVWNN